MFLIIEGNKKNKKLIRTMSKESLDSADVPKEQIRASLTKINKDTYNQSILKQKGNLFINTIGLYPIYLKYRLCKFLISCKSLIEQTTKNIY